MDNAERLLALQNHQDALRACRRCPQMHPPVITGQAVLSPMLLVGQAPGDREGGLGRPFAWTAGKTLFKWFASIGLEENAFRQKVYMAAVCRCFPGKKPKGGDRPPAVDEIEQCRVWLNAEIALLQPRLILPVGKLAISQWLSVDTLDQVVGRKHRMELEHGPCDLIPLPHPSGASLWPNKPANKALIAKAIQILHTVRSAWNL